MASGLRGQTRSGPSHPRRSSGYLESLSHHRGGASCRQLVGGGKAPVATKQHADTKAQVLFICPSLQHAVLHMETFLTAPDHAHIRVIDRGLIEQVEDREGELFHCNVSTLLTSASSAAATVAYFSYGI